MITIHLNGETHTLDRDCDIHTLIAQLELTGRRIAVELNQDIVPRSEFSTRTITDGDKVEIVHAIGGG